jgi:parallel beta-helix repeat protein
MRRLLTLLVICGAGLAFAPAAHACTGTPVTPADNLSAVVAAGAAGQTFCLADGTYAISSPVQPKAGQTIQAENPRGATIDANGVAADGIFSSAAGVSIVDVRVRGATDIGVELRGASNLVQNVESFENAHKGLQLNGNGSRVQGGYFHHNLVYGVGANGGSARTLAIDQSWSDVEVAYNRLGGICNSDSGGSKFVRTTRLALVRGNFHHNNCVGIWLDINNVNPVVQSTESSDNVGNGLICEISYGCLFADNRVFRNTGGGIIVRSSSDVEIRGNTLAGNSVGSSVGDLMLYGSTRTDHMDAGLPPHLTRGNFVHHNTVQGSRFGVISTNDPNPAALFDPTSNRFVGNDYDAPNCTRGGYWRWNGSKKWLQWRAVPQDGDAEASCI